MTKKLISAPAWMHDMQDELRDELATFDHLKEDTNPFVLPKFGRVTRFEMWTL